MLAENSYGKSGIRLVKLARLPDRHELRDVTVAVKLEGDFAAAHVSGDNAAILPTDTMKNTVYALANDRFDGAIESFGLLLARHFVERLPEIRSASIEIVEHGWERLNVRGAPHPHAFIRPGAESRLCSVRRDRQEEAVESGIEGLTVLKSADSAFAGFFKDEYTTLPETTDRIFATAIRAVWTYLRTDVPFDKTWLSVRQTLLETFAGHESASVQHTLHAMGEAALARHPEIARVSLSLPNKHHLLVDLSRFGLANKNEIFVATEEPYGLIEATVERG